MIDHKTDDDVKAQTTFENLSSESFVPTIITGPTEPVTQHIKPVSSNKPPHHEETQIQFDDCLIVKNPDGWRILKDGWAQKVNSEKVWLTAEDALEALEAWRKSH